MYALWSVNVDQCYVANLSLLLKETEGKKAQDIPVEESEDKDSEHGFEREVQILELLKALNPSNEQISRKDLGQICMGIKLILQKRKAVFMKLLTLIVYHLLNPFLPVNEKSITQLYKQSILTQEDKAHIQLGNKEGDRNFMRLVSALWGLENNEAVLKDIFGESMFPAK